MRLSARLRRSTRSDSEMEFEMDWTPIPNYISPANRQFGLAKSISAFSP
jgi:hypothetical protein